MMIAIFIVQCMILLIMFVMYGTVVENKSKEPNNDIKDVDKRDIEIFRSGLQQTWTYVNVSLYKMYRELDILDFDSIQNKLQQTLDELVKSPEEMERWAKKFNDYVKNQENEGE